MEKSLEPELRHVFFLFEKAFHRDWSEVLWSAISKYISTATQSMSLRTGTITHNVQYFVTTISETVKARKG